MKPVLISILCIPLLVSCQGPSPDRKQKAASNKPEGEIILSLFMAKNDEISGKNEGEILVFGKYSNNRFTPVTDYDEKSGKPVSERLSVLTDHKAFDVYYKGAPVSRVTISRIDSPYYDCERVIVGKSGNPVPSKILKERQSQYTGGMSGSVGDQKVSYTLTNFLALSANHRPGKSLIHAPQDPEITQASIEKQLQDRFKQHDNSASQKTSIKSVHQLRLSGESYPVFIVVAENDNPKKEVKVNLVYIFRYRAGKFESMVEQFRDSDYDSWGRGYQFIDAVDIDSDNNPELIFQSDGYEATGIIMYQYRNGAFLKVLETTLYGC